MQAIILAGGFGTRLKSILDHTPKPMALISERPFLAWLLDYMAEQGVKEVVLCLHYMPQQVQSYFGNSWNGMKVCYSIEREPLGTGGAIKQALDILKPSEPVFVLNGDSLVQLDYHDMLQKHQESGRDITIATRRVADCRRYSELTIKNNLIAHYELLGDAHEGNISTGFYVVSPDLFAGSYLPKAKTLPFVGLSEGLGEGGFSFERDFLSLHAPELMPAAYDRVGYFIDIGVPEDYARGQKEIPDRLAQKIAA